ncbi:RHS repeat-associated core domain-containing protein [Catellatospora sichuanensis]|uniref:RHS repeat-associated core domain-containing protein n=1 Tax=Catellatospora sichuanensis TaxID=1969805 RepID=UPI0011844BE8|nr:RHS repeat-associated core domain-containing protein [Catellatospora sichuanensis]
MARPAASPGRIWLYDTVANGQLTHSVRYIGGYNQPGTAAYVNRIDAYDDAYRPLTARTTIAATAENGALAGDYTTTMTYKDNGAPATVALPTVGGLPAETITTTYTTQGLPTAVKGVDDYLADITYRWDGTTAQTLHGHAGKQLRQTFTHDEATGRLLTTQIDAENQTTTGAFDDKFTTDYGYDAVGNITAIAGKLSGTRDQVECFKYDHLRRLTEAWTNSTWDCSAAPIAGGAGADPYWRQWTFDRVGNRLTQTDRGASGDTAWTYTVPGADTARPHSLTSVTANGPLATSTRNFTYDSAGNTLTRQTVTGVNQTLAWDPEGHLATLTEGTNNSSYLYDAEGNRLFSRAPGKTTLYLGGTDLELRTDGGPVLGTRYYTVGGKAVAVRRASGLAWTCADHNGTQQVQIDSVTLEAAHNRTLPYGEFRGAQTAFVGGKGYVGGQRDDTGLTHLGAREYDPTLGRFITVDPVMDLKNPQQWNAYAYSNSNPVTYSDPSGLIACGDDACKYTVKPSRDGQSLIIDDKRSSDLKSHTRQVIKLPKLPQKSTQGGTDPCAVAPESELCKALALTVTEIQKNSAGPDVGNIEWQMGNGCGFMAYFFGMCGTTASQINALDDFMHLVCKDCKWDHKPTIQAMWGGSKYAVDPVTGAEIFYDIFSNVHYGYVGREAAIDSEMLQSVNLPIPKNPVTGQSERSDAISTQIGIDLQSRYRPEQITTQILYMSIMGQQGAYLQANEGKIR